jgi:hypothetical protein
MKVNIFINHKAITNRSENHVKHQQYENEGFLFSLSFIVLDWLQVVHQEWLQDPKLSCLIQ